MKINGLNDEQIQYIVDYAKNDKYPANITNEKQLLEYLREDYNYEIEGSEKRWWTEFTAITIIGDRFFGYHAAKTTGDDSPHDLGFEPEDYVYEYQPKETTITTYERKK